MKKLSLILALFAITFASIPTFAQKAKILGTGGLIMRNNPVIYSSAEAFSEGRGVWLQWKTDFESKNLGFYVYRISGGETEQVSSSLIPGAYLQAREEQITSGGYTFFDPNGTVDSTYFIESVNVSGKRYNSNQIQTQYVDDLSSIAGISLEELNNRERTANPITFANDSILPRDLASEVANSVLPPDPVTQRWVAAQGGVRIGVKNEGFYRVLRADLLANGFDVNAPVERWQLYVNGVQQSINVGANGSYIEFYGKGVDALESETQIYFLVVGTQNGKRINSQIRARIGSPLPSNSYSQSFYMKERTIYSQSLLNGDDDNYFGRFIGSDIVNIPFNVTGVDFNTATTSIDVTIQGGTLVPHQLKVFVNNVAIGNIAGNNYDLMKVRFNIPTSALQEGANTIGFQSLGGSSDVSFFSSIKVNFARNYRAEQNKISFYVPNYKTTTVGNFSSANIRIFDTTNSDSPILLTGLPIQQNGTTFSVTLPSNRGRVLLGVEDSGVLQPFSISANTPSTLSTTSNNGEFIIISYKDWLTQAEDWANYRRSQGMNVKVVNIEDVYDEFNYGVLSSDSIRTFLNYAKNNWTTTPNYVLLLGDATYDPKNYAGGINHNYLPTRLVDTIYTETGSDDTLADFNDDGLAEIAIGRIPARDSATVTLALNKVIAFEQNLGTGSGQGINRGALFASDLPDGYDFEGLSHRLAAQMPVSVPKVEINRALSDAQAQLVSQMNAGKFIINYSGHGNVGVWASNGFFNNANSAQLTNSGNKLSIFTMLTCLNGYFIQPTDSLTEVLLKNQNGGAVATWASTGLTTPDIQEVMATRFYSQIGAGNITRLGSLINDAKTTINFGRDVRLSWVLLGDPTLKVK